MLKCVYVSVCTAAISFFSSLTFLNDCLMFFASPPSPFFLMLLSSHLIPAPFCFTFLSMSQLVTILLSVITFVVSLSPPPHGPPAAPSPSPPVQPPPLPPSFLCSTRQDIASRVLFCTAQNDSLGSECVMSAASTDHQINVSGQQPANTTSVAGCVGVTLTRRFSRHSKLLRQYSGGRRPLEGREG